MPDYNNIPPTLPDGWQAILDNIAARLQEAIAAVDARAALLPSAADEPAAAARRAELAARATELAERAAQAKAQADAADGDIAASEAYLRWRLGEAESLRQRVAAWRQSIG